MTSIVAKPSDSDAARMTRSRREKAQVEMIFIPATATVVKRKVVTPPRTGVGIARKTPEIFARMPKMTLQESASIASAWWTDEQ